MKACFVLCATSSADKGTIILEGINTDMFLMLGSSLPASVSPDRYTYVNSLTIAVERGKKGVMAVRVTTARFDKKYTNYIGFLLPVEWKGDDPRPFVDLEHPFVPRGDRLGQVVDDHLEVVIDGKTFTTNEHAERDEPGKVYIPDGNLLCKYLVGDVDAEEVKAAATECAEEEAARKKLPETLNTLQDARHMLDRQGEHIRYLDEQCKKAQNDLQALRVLSDALRDAVRRQLFKRPSVRRALAAL